MSCLRTCNRPPERLTKLIGIQLSLEMGSIAMMMATSNNCKTGCGGRRVVNRKLYGG